MDNNQLIIEALNKLVTNINELNEEMHAMKEVTATMTHEQLAIENGPNSIPMISCGTKENVILI